MSKNTYTRRINLYINDKEVKHNIQSIQKEFYKANNELKRMEVGSKEYIAQTQKVKGLKGILNEHNQQLKEVQKTGFSFSKLSDGFNKYFGIITAGAASFAGLIMAGRKAVDEFNKFDDQVADVMKTTGMTKDEVLELDKRLQKINTRTAQDELLGLGRVAGKLGITGVEDVEGFVRAADKINVALSEDLGGDAEQAINEIGKLTDIFKLKDEFGIEQSMLKVGSAINSLGAASTANEGYLVEFTKRMAGVAPAANVSIDQVLGLGATLDQFGQTSEVSSTTIAAVLTDMFKSPGEYAAIAGMKIEDFNDLLAKDSNEAFIKFLEGLNGNNDGLGVMANKLEGLGLAGKRSVSVLGVLSNNTQTLREQQALSAAEFEKGTSLQDEFNIKNETAQARLEKARKAMGLYRRELGEKLQPIMAGVVSQGTLMLKFLSALIDIFDKYRAQIIIVAGAIATYTAIQKIKANWDKISYGITLVKTSAEKAYGIIMGALTGKIKLQTIAQMALNAAKMLDPTMLIVASVAALAAGTVYLIKRMREQTAAQKAVNDVSAQAKRDIIEQKQKTEDLLAVAKDENKSLEERKAALEELKRISPEYFGNLSIEQNAKKQLTESGKKLLAIARDENKSLEERNAALEELKKTNPGYFDDLDREKATTEALIAAGEAYIANLEKEALVKAAQAKINELRDANAHKEIDIETKKKKWYESTSGAARRATKDIEGNKEAIEALQAVIDKNTALSSPELSDDEKAKIAAAEAEKARKKAADEQAEAERIAAEERRKANEEASKKALEQLEKNRKIELNILKNTYLEKSLTEDEYNAEMQKREMENLLKKLDIQKKYGQETIDTEASILDLKLKLQADADKKTEEEKKKAYKKAEDLLSNQQTVEENLIKEQLSNKLIDEDEANLLLIANEIEFLYKKIALKKEYGEETAELEGKILDLTQKAAAQALKDDEKRLKELADLKKQYATDEQRREMDMAAEFAELDRITKNGALVSHEEYERMKTAITEKYAGERFQKEQEYLQAADQLLSMFMDVSNARKTKELKAAGDNAAAKEAIEKKYAKSQQKIQIAQAMAAGAMAILQIWKGTTTGEPISDTIIKGIMSAIVAGKTGAEISTIKSQQFKTGGYTPNAPSDSKPVGTVHANEWVASAPLLRDPEARSHIDYLERKQRGFYPRFNTASISGAVNGGFKVGGYSSTPPPIPGATNTTANNDQMEQNNAMMGAMLGLLTDLKQNGIKATAEVNTQEVFSKQQQYENNIKASEL